MPQYQKNTPADQLKKETFLKQANEAYAAMKKDPKQWSECQEELALWDATLADGLRARVITFYSEHDNKVI